MASPICVRITKKVGLMPHREKIKRRSTEKEERAHRWKTPERAIKNPIMKERVSF